MVGSIYVLPGVTWVQCRERHPRAAQYGGSVIGTGRTDGSVADAVAAGRELAAHTTPQGLRPLATMRGGSSIDSTCTSFMPSKNTSVTAAKAEPVVVHAVVDLVGLGAGTRDTGLGRAGVLRRDLEPARRARVSFQPPLTGQRPASICVLAFGIPARW